MEMHVLHETIYEYAEPVKRSVQSLRLTPRRDPGQRVDQWHMQTPGRTSMQIDAHGNVVHLLTLDTPHREIRIQVRGIVEIDAHQDGLFFDQGRLSPLAYLAETPLTTTSDELHKFAAKYVKDGKASIESLMQLSDAICDAVEYRKGVTAVHDTASEAFKRGEGVCQDHAHIFVACCRAVGIPARYVSGYFYPGDVEQVASHAWVDAWLGNDKGWLSLDVTHRTIAAQHHCRLAVGRDYMEACPIRGVRRGGGDEEMRVSVSIAHSSQQ